MGCARSLSDPTTVKLRVICWGSVGARANTCVCVHYLYLKYILPARPISMLFSDGVLTQLMQIRGLDLVYFPLGVWLAFQNQLQCTTSFLVICLSPLFLP